MKLFGSQRFRGKIERSPRMQRKRERKQKAGRTEAEILEWRARQGDRAALRKVERV